MTTLRGELKCFSCARYLGEFEAHPDDHGRRDVHLLKPEEGELRDRPVETDEGLRCSRCGGRVVLEYLERAA
jgi:hypothetical protein